MRLLFIFLSLTIFSGCYFPSKPSPVVDSTPPAKEPEPVVSHENLSPIEGTNFRIKIPVGYTLQIENDSNSKIINIIPIVKTTGKEPEIGLYLGNQPNGLKPTGAYTEIAIPGLLLEKRIVWTRYHTSTWWQQETIIPYETQMLHIWCYAWSESELDSMMQTIQTLTEH